MKAARDDVIAQYALQTDAVIATKDEDFVSQSAHAGTILWLRLGNVTNRRLFGRLLADWPEIERLLDSGARVVEVR